MVRWNSSTRRAYSRGRRNQRNVRGNQRRFWRGVKTGFNTTKDIALTALQIAKGVKGLINVEFKVKDDAAVNSVIPTGIVHHMTDMSQGDTNTQRDGESVKLTGGSFRSYVVHNVLGLTEQIIRVIIFRDIDSRGATPAVTDLLNTADVLSHRNLDNTARFTIIKDRLISVNGDNDIQLFRTGIKGPMHIKWTGVNGNDTASGHLYMLYLCNEPSANYPQIKWNYRLRYVDN